MDNGGLVFRCSSVLGDLVIWRRLLIIGVFCYFRVCTRMRRMFRVPRMDFSADSRKIESVQSVQFAEIRDPDKKAGKQMSLQSNPITEI